MANSDSAPKGINFDALQHTLGNRLVTNLEIRRIYANDASIYEQIPIAVAFPSSDADVRALISFANERNIGLIPRAAGTSLAGQVVGSGVVVDVSRFMTSIQEINKQQRWVRVQPGVVRDELNQVLKSDGLFFAPETSTSNRAMIGGMYGNNSCGANSIRFGTTREHIIEVTGFLSDGTKVTFEPNTTQQFHSKCQSNHGLEAELLRHLKTELDDPNIRQAILDNFPKRTIHRRNTGYAVDLLLETTPFGGTRVFNFAQFIAGSEGTLFLATELKLNCEPLPVEETFLLCAHFKSVHESLIAAQFLMKYEPERCELIDDNIIAGAMLNASQKENLDFVRGTPKAILMAEYSGENVGAVRAKIAQVVQELKNRQMGYEFPVLHHAASKQAAWSLRKAGLGVLQNQPGNRKPIAFMEDMAVALEDYPRFATEVSQILMDKFAVSCVFYGHAGAGELHLRPKLDVGDPHDRILIREIGQAMSDLVKRYRGSLSGEHGDGRLRSEFIPFQVGATCYQLFQRIKKTWDPNGIFNPGKITNALPMDVDLRAGLNRSECPDTVFHYRKEGGFLTAASSCSGSGDCRKSHLIGGTMCPSYMATRNEYDSTRGRANLLRQMLAGPGKKLANFSLDELRPVTEAMDLCLACKACKLECPSNVDMAKLKSELLQMKHDSRGISFRSQWMGSIDTIFNRLSRVRRWVNRMTANKSLSAALIKKIVGIHPNRSLPILGPQTLRKWFDSRSPNAAGQKNGKRVVLLCDEFTNHLDVDIGIATVELLELLGYHVEMSVPLDSGRAALSAGLLRRAKTLALRNVSSVIRWQSPDTAIVGIEPSSILTFRDEYVDLVDDEYLSTAKQLADSVLLIDEFVFQEARDGHIRCEQFSPLDQTIALHGHCHQKALSSVEYSKRVLELCVSKDVNEIPSGCCGMAGFFGYEKDKYELSNQIGELRLLPAIRDAPSDTMIVATGHSCRHQILDGAQRQAMHPMQVLRQQFKTSE